MREPIHPGETLREDLEALGMSASELARRIEVPVNRITEILAGRRAVTGDTALRLGRVLAQPSETLRTAPRGARQRRGHRPAADAGRHRRPARAELTGARRPDIGILRCGPASVDRLAWFLPPSEQ